MATAEPGRITAETKINDVLARYPGTAPVFTQGHRLYVDQKHDLYARFPGLTVGDFARQNRLELEPILSQLNALAESGDAADRPAPHAADDRRVGQFSLTLGYTASYRPREDAQPDSVSVVAVQSARGPE
ncbi:MAG TPA: hypothetical protein VIA61_06615 [Methylomirabilota bacterium]|jgi:hypothetical protein